MSSPKFHRRVKQLSGSAVLASCLVLACLAFAPLALAEEELDAAAPSTQLRIQASQQRWSAASGSTEPWSGAETETTTQTWVWAQRQRVMLGVGVQQQTGTSWSNLGDRTLPASQLVVGFGWATGRNSSVSWELPVPNTRSGTLADAPTADHGNSRALSFQGRNALADLPRGGILKIQMSAQTALALRTRRGALGVMLSSRW